MIKPSVFQWSYCILSISKSGPIPLTTAHKSAFLFLKPLYLCIWPLIRCTVNSIVLTLFIQPKTFFISFLTWCILLVFKFLFCHKESASDFFLETFATSNNITVIFTRSTNIGPFWAQLSISVWHFMSTLWHLSTGITTIYSNENRNF